jgi:hypothetical protein
MASRRGGRNAQPPAAGEPEHMACLPGPLELTAEELLRELVQEHKVASFEYRAASFTRNGSWTGGDEPIEDRLTKKRFEKLAAWCRQVRLAAPSCR